MAEFGASATEAPQVQNFITPKEGVVEAASGVALAGDLFGQVRAIRGNQKEKRQQDFLANFTNTQLGLIESVEQGGSSQFARSRIRANLMQAIQANPGLREELIKSNASILGIGGLGGDVVSGSPEERRRESLRDNLVTSGQVSADADENTILQAERNFQVATASKERYDSMMSDITLQKAQVGLNSDQLSLLNQKEKYESERFLSDTAPAFLDSFKTNANRVIEQIGRGGFTEGDAVQAIEEGWAAFQSSISEPLSNVDSSQATAMLNAYEQFKDIALKRAKGEYSQEEFDRQVNRVVSQQQVLALGDPVIARAAASSKLFGNNFDFSTERAIQGNVSSFILGNSAEGGNPANLFLSDPSGKSALESYFKLIGKEDLSDTEKAEQAIQLGNVFKGVVSYESFLTENPESGITLVNNWMATPEFLRLRREQPELFSDISISRDILKRNYEDEVWGMVRREFRNNNIVPLVENTGGRGGVQGALFGENANPALAGVPSNSLVTYRSTSSGMEFASIDPENRDGIREARRLNRDLAPIINKTVKAFAHIDGSDDYKGYFEAVADELVMGGEQQGDDDLEGGAGNDMLSLDDFTPPVITPDSLPEDVKADTEFMEGVNTLSSKYELDPSVLLGIMDFETGGSFDPAQKNAAGSSGTGLIQFMRSTARDLGTSVEDLSSLSRSEQLTWVEKYLDQYESKIKGGDVADVYMAVLYPAAIDKPDSYALFTRGTLAYTQNRGLDKDGNGYITKAEAASTVRQRARKHS